MTIGLFDDHKRSMSIGNHERSLAGGSDEWITPKWIIDSLGPFDLDPCAAVIMPWQTANRCYTEMDNGLFQKWEGFVWMNPPYGTATSQWLGRIAEHNHGIALIFARTETEMFFNHVWAKASALLFLKGRVHFHRRDGALPSAKGKGGSGGSGAPSVLVAYGPLAKARLEKICHKGALVTAWKWDDLTALTNGQRAVADTDNPLNDTRNPNELRRQRGW